MPAKPASAAALRALLTDRGLDMYHEVLSALRAPDGGEESALRVAQEWAAELLPEVDRLEVLEVDSPPPPNHHHADEYRDWIERMCTLEGILRMRAVQEEDAAKVVQPWRLN